jgi:signal transduction histidine kinase
LQLLQPVAPLETSLTTAVDQRTIAVMRLVLAASALVIIAIDPTEPSRLVVLTYLALSLYTAYSAALYLHLLRQPLQPGGASARLYWLDVGWYVILSSLSQGTSSIFFFGFFFAILVASFQDGRAAGLQVTLASAVLYALIGLVTSPVEVAQDLNRFLLRPVYLLVLGYMMAYWGGFEILLKRRLALLREVTALGNPRFGVDHTIGTLLARVCTFYQAEACFMVLADPARETYRLHRASDHVEPGAVLPPPAIQALLAVPPGAVLVYPERPPARWSPFGGRPPDPGATLAATLNATAFVSVPVRYGTELIGRFYLVARQRRFSASDGHFLVQLVEQVTPILQNIQLVDRLASDAADHERQRIARNIHDSVIQPYIGLQMGLAATQQKLCASGSPAAPDLARLLALSDDGIADLRAFVHDLTGTTDHEGGFLPAVRRYSGKFQAATGITVQVEAPADLHLHDRLAAELFQIVAEGLSNVRRHTQATRVIIRLSRRIDGLGLEIENDRAASPRRFLPRSIAGRAAALGGTAQIQHPAPERTIVCIHIPL